MKLVVQQLSLWILLLVSSAAWAQTRILTGSVSDDKNQPIVGASILIKGTTTGTYSDADGKFTLAVPADASTLIVKFIGMKTKEITLGTENTIDITMVPDILGLDEVVVTANAVVREKRGLGYATQQVTGEDLTVGRNPNALGSLSGKVSGVNVTSLTGGPGSSNRIVIRGGTSLDRNNQALIVVDGVPIDNGNFRTLTADGSQDDDLDNQVDFGNRGNDINPDDIESITVLKGPAAAALYGSRASNGALIITTKKGKRSVGGNKRLDIAVSAGLTFSTPMKLPEFQNTYGQGDLDFVYDDRRENFSWGLPFDGALRPWGQRINGKTRIKPYSAIPNNVRDFFEVGKAYRNNVSFSGGTQKTSYYLSVGSLNSTGVIPTTRYDKYNVLFNASTEFSNHFTSSISINYSNISGVLPTGGQQNQSVYQNLMQTPRDIPIVDGKDLNDPFNKYDDVLGTYGFYAGYALNPYFILENYKNTNNVDRLFGNVTLTYAPLKWLSITNRFGGDAYADRRYQKWKKYEYEPIDPLYAGNNQSYQGKYSEDLYNLNSFTNDLMATFNHDINKDLGVTLLLGQNVRQSILNNTYAQTNVETGLVVPGYYNLSNSNGAALARNTLTKTRNVGYYADLTLSFKRMLFLDLTGRRDKSSTLPAENSTYFYPSASVSWVFSEMFPASLKDKAWTYGKLRASYAKVGNDAPAYVTTDYYTVTNIRGGFGATQFPFNNVPGYTKGDVLANNNIKPEFTSAIEVGTELGFWNDRLSIDFSYYQNSSKDQIINLPLSFATGYGAQTVNTGEIRNKGVELAIRVTPVSTKSGFKWELYGTYTKNTNKVVSLTSGVQQITLGGASSIAVVAQVGQPYGAFYGIDLLKDPNGNVVVDASGLPRLTSNLVYLGNYQPDYLASWGSTFSFKGFVLDILFDTKQGGVYYSDTKRLMDFIGVAKETENRANQVWPGSVFQNPDGSYSPNTVPYHPYDYFVNIAGQTEAGTHIVDASYIKLREISFGYKFPAKWVDKTPFGAATISVFGNNLFIWTPAENQYADPELNSSGAGNVQGFEFGALPAQRNFGFDLKVTF